MTVYTLAGLCHGTEGKKDFYCEFTAPMWCCVLSDAIREVKKLIQVHRLGKAGISGI